MAITPVTATATSGAQTTGFTLVINSGVQAGDILLLGITNRDGTADPGVVDNDTGGNAWAKVTNQNAATNGAISVWWKRATATTASKTITVSGCTGSASGVVTPYRGSLAAGTPYGTPVPEANISGNETTAGISTTAAGSFVCLFVGCTSNDTLNPTTYTATDPTTLTERGEGISTGGSDCSMSHASAERSAAGATGAISWAQTDGTGASIVFELKAEPVVATGTTSITQAANTSSGTAAVSVAGSASVTQAANTATATAAVGVGASASLTQAADTATSSAAVTAAGATASASATQAADTMSGTASVSVGVSAAITQAANTATSTAAVGVTSSASVTQAANTGTSAAAIAVTASTSLTQTTNTVSAASAVSVAATAALTQSADTTTGTATASAGPSGVVSVTQAANTISAGAAVGMTASAAIIQAANTATASSTVALSATSAVTQAADVCTATASVIVGAVAAMAQDANTIAANVGAFVTRLAIAEMAQGEDVVTSSAIITSNEPHPRKHARTFAAFTRASRFGGPRRLGRQR